MRQLTLILLSIILIHCNLDKKKNQNNSFKKESSIKPVFQLKLGDLLFQDLDSSPLCDAIEKVTPGYHGANLSHVGIVIETGDPNCLNPNYRYNDYVKILEALPEGVVKTKVDTFLNRSFDKNGSPKVIVGRLKTTYQSSIKDAISFMNKKQNIEYDDEFLMNNDKYYCSELIYDAFKQYNIFQLQPMTFIDPDTGEISKIWEEYYMNLKMKAPENKLGINPGIMSLSKKIDIIHIYGNPEGLND